MNYDNLNKIADYCRTNLMPHLKMRLSLPDFSAYLSKISESPSCRWIRSDLKAYPIYYFVDPIKFAAKYSKKCITFCGTANPQDGAMLIIYQISPTLHVLARLYHWVEHEEVKAYMVLTATFQNYDEFLSFYDENLPLRLEGNTEDRTAGFGSVFQSTGLGLQGFSNKSANDKNMRET